MSPLPFYLITHRCGDGVYTYETRTDAPPTWLELVNLIWTGEVTNVERITKITPPRDCYNHGRTEDATPGMVNALTWMSDKLQETPCKSVQDFLAANGGTWFETETDKEAYLRQSIAHWRAA